MADLKALKAEIQGDPALLGYAPWVTLSDDMRIQGLLLNPTLRPRSSVTVAAFQVVNRIDTGEFAALTQILLLRLQTILSAGQVDLAASTVRDILRDIFPAAGATRIALVALWNAQIQTRSRAEELGLGATIEELTQARLLP